MIANWFLRRFFLAGAALFTISLGVSFFAKDYVRGLAEDFVYEHVAKQADGVAKTMETQLEKLLANRLLSKEIHAAITAEIQRFRDNPHAYVRGVIRDAAAQIPDEQTGGVVAERIAGFKRSLVTAFDDTMAALVRDLLIFNATNVAAFLIAWCLARLDRPRWAVSLTVLSWFLFLATLYSTWMYIDQNWFFNILFKSYMGWSYPSLIALFFVWITLENATDAMRFEEETPAKEAASSQDCKG
jgi:hypothetical protein